MIFFLLFNLILLSVYGYVGARIIPALLIASQYKTLVWLALGLGCLSVPLFFLLRMNTKGYPWMDTLAWFAYVNLGFVTLLFSAAFTRDLFYWISASYFAISSSFGEIASPAFDPERRRFLASGVNLVLVGVACLATGIGFLQAIGIPKVKRVLLDWSSRHRDLSNLKIVQLTDLHIGPTIKKKFVESVVEKVNALNPDVIAITGDLVDGTVEALAAHVEPLSRLSAKAGVYFVTGNHEYYAGAESWNQHLSTLGIKVLSNENTTIEIGQAKILLAGVTDYSTRGLETPFRSDPIKAGRCDGEFHLKVLLAHQPKSVYQAAEAGFDLQLSGHTHGGQYFPSTWLVHLFQPFVAGLYTHKKTKLYVSKGTGYWGPPLRLMTESEITEFVSA